jgi:glucose-6-phosphate isomerase
MHGAHDLAARGPIDPTASRDRLYDTFHFSPGPLADAIAAHTAIAARAAAGLFRRDPSVWSGDAGVQAKIAERLGWLASPSLMAEAVPRLQAFADGVVRDGFAHVVLLGMGGSSLAPEVLRAILGVQPGRPAFHMIDSTDPAAVAAVATPPERTLFVLASKSGTTIEPNALAAHFRVALERAGATRWADHFVAITDPATALAERARADGFRETFLNPADIGGRYSALSYFGLVPAALMGQDVGALAGWGSAMMAASDPGFGEIDTNPAVGLGLAMGAGARRGRDKLTLIVPPALEPFGLWVEQLVAESTGKRGTGIVPIAGEPPAAPAAYGGDRLFVCVRMSDADDAQARELRAAGAPVAAIDLPDPAALGAEFARWEIATAVAAAILGVNPFDEPNVQQAKDATRVLLDRYQADGRLPTPSAGRANADGVTLTLSAAASNAVAVNSPDAVLTLLKEGDYFALLAYLGPDDALAGVLASFRNAVRDRTRNATMFGYGPRYLHSTGQLHKGGGDSGVFVLVTATPRQDLPIPGEPFSFGTLELAQAVGDFQSLDAAGRRALHLHLPAPDADVLQRTFDRLLECVR